MRFIIDRIEEGFAVCEREDGTSVKIPLAEFPAPVREGEHYIFSDGGFRRDEASEAEAKRRNIALQNALFE